MIVLPKGLIAENSDKKPLFLVDYAAIYEKFEILDKKCSKNAGFYSLKFIKTH